MTCPRPWPAIPPWWTSTSAPTGNPIPLLEVQALAASYGDVRVLSAVTLSVAAGEIVALVGGNGAGKSTLLKSIAGLLPPRGRHPLGGRGSRSRGRAPDRRARPRHGPGGAPALRGHDRAGASRPGRLHSAGAGRAPGEPRARPRLLPLPARAAPPRRPLSLGRAAADGGHRACPHEQSPAPDAGRALARDRPAPGADHPDRARGDQPGRRGRPPRRAERAGRAHPGPSRLCPRVGPDHRRGAERRLALGRACPPRLSRPAGHPRVSALAQQIVLGILIGGLYGLAAAGLSLVFGVLKVLNVAHGELIMLGGYAAFWAVALLGMDPFGSLVLVVPLSMLAGFFLYGALFGFVVRANEETREKNSLLIGFGLALVLHALAVRLWTADERSIITPYGGAVIMVAGLSIPVVRLLSLVLAFAVIGGLQLLLTHWRWGKAIRATAEDWQAALLTGIDVRRAYLLAFAIGTGLAGIAGVLVSVGYSISPSIGLEWTLKALIVVVLAGLGSMIGTFIGGILLGVAEALSAAAFGGPYREVVGLVIFVVVLCVRPRGLFGR